MNEFAVIDRWFAARTFRAAGTVRGIGDDAALLQVPPGELLAVTTDTLVEGVHFFPDDAAADIGWKALAVNLSDLAAMAAEPRWAFLALTLPEVDATWLDGFCAGFFELAGCFGVELAGGDTTCGPLSVTVQALGLVPAEAALGRDRARVGDDIYLTGRLGLAGLALEDARHASAWADAEACRRLRRPEPRVAVAMGLRKLAHGCIDVSDGLVADLGHVLAASGVGGVVHYQALPLSPATLRYLDATGNWAMPLCCGDDYELCFTAPATVRGEVEALAAHTGVALTRIGTIEPQPGLRVLRQGRVMELERTGYRHFE